MYAGINPICWDEYGNEIDHLTQWDKSQRLVLEFYPADSIVAPPYVDFCNELTENEALRIQSKITDGKIIAEIPDNLLAEPYTIYAYVRMSDNAPDRYTAVKAVAIVKIPVIPCAKPGSYVIDDPHSGVTLDDINYLASKNEHGIKMILSGLINGLHYCGETTYDKLPENPIAGDFYLCTDKDNKYYSWNGVKWYEIETFTLEHFHKVEEMKNETSQYASEAMNAKNSAAKSAEDAAKSAEEAKSYVSGVTSDAPIHYEVPSDPVDMPQSGDTIGKVFGKTQALLTDIFEVIDCDDITADDIQNIVSQN